LLRKKVKRCTYNVILWRVPVTVFQWRHQCILCACVVVVDLRVTVNYIRIFSVAQQCFMTNLYHRQQCELYVPLFERHFIPTNFHSFHTLQINAALKEKNVRLIMAFRSTI
jgi:hypothetical protein